ncbi:hypothetical protein CC85DRAFT_182052 [Cutaneotrichosporon oleaginosum]|uniref:DH domain-containing protein n=1 Tax=Cutaneotrichosporon oleaginosum TaxID=879819 RepID=A0A0J0XF46_9TREE|nr:uncharacterized protein CC85DRAFT_182052 [Cutaneotrichosporon oleaginosum]KLT39702.1 hypothetical protein CC85DRAFT_182052 [Cutaneotrichosporon oleaginosum]TXT12418.1 hypothetical protein COLE_02828 [Cutaneotrichosporon oleaginosum]
MALTHTALTEALAGPSIAHLDSRSSRRTSSLGLTLSSPLHGLTPCSSRNSSTSDVRSFHTARLTADESPASPDRRHRPSPISIPIHSPDAPLFSSYPLSGGARASQRGQHVVTPETSQSASASNAVSPSQSRTGVKRATSDGGFAGTGAAFSPIRSPQPGTSVSRRRSLSTLGLVKHLSSPSSPQKQPSKHKRRASWGSGDFDVARRRDMAAVAQLDNLPYGFGPDPRKASVSECLAPISSADHPADLLSLADLTISHKHVPKRSSSLGKHLLLSQDVPTRTTSLHCDPHAMDNISLVSISEPSLSSPSILTTSLPSTKTSLSRSVRNGKEGDELKRAELAQVSQALLDRRRMILLEIVETEVTYVHQLRALVYVYLPQLAVLPFVSDRIHQHIARNSVDLLEFHVQFAAHMVDILKYSGLGYDVCDSKTLDTVTKELANLFVREVPSFRLYSGYCAGSMVASSVVSDITHRVDYENFEKRCQHITSETTQASLQDMLYNKPGSPSRTRLRFKDILIAPIQRVCRYPLLLASLLADINREAPPNDVVESVEAAQAVMRAVAENADDARLRKEAELKTARVAECLEPHNALSKEFLNRLGTCRLIGALDVLYHHPIHAPLDRPTKVRYFAALLYRGYLILAKVRRNKTLEARHFLPLEVVELIDITEGSLPFSLRLTINDHKFDLAASCDAEKELWAAELKAARDESTMPPFELPSSVPLFQTRSRHSSTTSRDASSRTPSKQSSMLPSETFSLNKRHTLVATADFQLPTKQLGTPPALEPMPLEDSPDLEYTPEYRQFQPSNVLIRRPSLTTRLMVDRALGDVISEGLATARSKAQFQYPSGPDPRRMSRFETPKLRRRRSLAGLSEMRPLDVVSTQEVRGAVIPGSRPRSLMRTRSFILPTPDKELADISRNTSMSSLSDAHRRRSPMSSLRGLEMTMGPAARAGHQRAQSASTLSQPLVQSPLEMMEDEMLEEEKPRKSLNRARSMPSSPITPTVEAFPDMMSQSTGAMRGDKDSYVLVKNEVPRRQTTSNLPRSTTPMAISPARAVKRSLSFFGRKSLSALTTDSSDEHGSAVSAAPSPSTTPPTPDATPATPKRRRSIRLLGTFRGFTPI